MSKVTLSSIKILGLLFTAICFSGCTGTIANINSDKLPMPDYDFKVDRTVSFGIGKGSQNYFEGGPASFGGSALKVRIDLKQTQEIVAQKLLVNLFTKISDLESAQDINIVSTLNNFSFRWPFEFKMKPRTMISFVLSLSAYDSKNNLIYSNRIMVVDYLGSESEEVIGLSAGFWPLMQKDADRVSQLVGDTLLEKVYQIYSKEFKKIAQIKAS